MYAMADMRRPGPEPPPGPPGTEFKPGMARDLLAELAPLLAGEGIDVSNLGATDVNVLRQAIQRAIERRDMALFTPAGKARDLAAGTLRRAVEAIVDGDSALAGSILDQAQPESPDGSAATVAGCIGVACGLLDAWLSGQEPGVPAGLARMTRLPAGHWAGERAATDILYLAAKGRAFGSLDALIGRQGGKQVLYGSALALAAVMRGWSLQSGTSVADLAATAVR